MRLDPLTFTALGGIAAFLIGTALLLEDGRALFAPVFGMVGGIAAVASANHGSGSVSRRSKSGWRSRNGVTGSRLRGTVETAAKRIRSGAAHRGSGAHRLRRARRRSRIHHEPAGAAAEAEGSRLGRA